MKNILSLIAIASLAAGSAFAGCGKIDTTEGKLKSYNAETKVAVVETKDKKTVNVTLTPTSKGGEGVDKLVGKKVKVLASHGKVTEIGKS
ncbi:MAG: hypothetical protein K1X78_19175 [Verrucomicrobiaceae bacterium]|nr:hypothetical protein [Verrucomicrobiaceae bacterium]